MANDGSFDTLRAKRIELIGNPADTALVDGDGSTIKGGGSASVVVPPGVWVTPDGAAQGSSSAQLSMAADGLYYARAFLPVGALTITDIRVDHANTGAGTVRIGLVKVDAAGDPTELVADIGTVDVSSAAGIKEINSLSVNITGDSYYAFCAISDVAIVLDAVEPNIGGYGWNNSHTTMVAYQRILSQASEHAGFSDPPPAPDAGIVGTEPIEIVQCKVVAT